MPASATFVATQKAAVFIPLLNELANGIFTTAAVQNSNFAAVKGYQYPLGTTGLTVTLPASPTVGDRLRIMSASSSVLSVTLAWNGSNIDSVAADKTLAGPSTSINAELVYVSAGVGWIVVRGSATETFEVKTTGFTAAIRSVYAITASTFTATLPASPGAGDWVRIFAGDATVTAITLGRNSSNINGAAADYTINALQWSVLAYYVNSTVGWLLVFETTMEPAARWDSTARKLKYHNSQRELSDDIGWAPYAYGLAAPAPWGVATALSLPASGGSVAFPVFVPSHMLLQSVAVRNTDTTLQRDLEWRLYQQKLNNGNAGENTLDEVPNANGTLSFTAAAASWQTSTPSSPPIYLPPGVYWMVFRNTNGSNTFGVGTDSTAAAYGNNAQTKTLGSALGSTLDFVAATWTKVPNAPWVVLSGRVFGNTAAF